MTNRLALVAVLLPLGFSTPHCSSTAKSPAAKPVAPTTVNRQATEQDERWSPHETICRLLEGNRVTITYGRPYREDHVTHERRPVWGGPKALVPFDKIWRLGADEATMLVTQRPLDMGGVSVPAGAYTLFFVLKSDGSGLLVINREIGQWGIDPYHFDRELARIPLRRETLPEPIDQLRIALDPAPTHGGVLRIMWDTTEFSVPYHVQPIATDAGGRPGAAAAANRAGR